MRDLKFENQVNDIYRKQGWDFIEGTSENFKKYSEEYGLNPEDIKEIVSEYNYASGVMTTKIYGLGYVTLASTWLTLDAVELAKQKRPDDDSFINEYLRQETEYCNGVLDYANEIILPEHPELLEQAKAHKQETIEFKPSCIEFEADLFYDEYSE